MKTQILREKRTNKITKEVIKKKQKKTKRIITL